MDNTKPEKIEEQTSFFARKELNLLKEEFRIFEEDTNKKLESHNENLEKSVERNIGKQVSLLTEDIKRKADNLNDKGLIPTKVASIFMANLGITNLTTGCLILSMGGMLSTIMTMLSSAGGQKLPPGATNIFSSMADTINYAGMVFLGLGIVGIILTYFLWKGSMVAGTLSIVTLIINLFVLSYEFKMMADFTAIFSGTFALVMVPEYVMAIFPLVLISSDWRNLK